ncbi:thioredoxin [Labrys sp. LIt4]|uniref:Thioredoxin n=1 Tax=Labrys okinawensis TaxID=346911 RepID=A0A2S9Q960_9HYPH|nr:MULTISPECIES: thioredoxin [Labrys]MBP0580772.1 thioredoxin [Labrys sp. LIt4]PRH85885.1 thioredoxin [Labrys okinawensis]
MMSNDAAGANGLIKDTTTQTFMADVIQESMKQPVLVDFWAEWCGPCKQLGPMLEKAVLAAKGKVKLVKMDIDKHPQIAGQLGVQSIPAVFAFSKGQPVDGFMGAIPESQIKEFISRIAGPGGDPDTEALLAEAEALLNEGDGAAAAQLFAQIFEQDAENLKAIAGLARCALAAGELEQAKATLSLTPKGKENDPVIASARAALELAEQANDVGDLQALARQVEAEPKNFQAKFDYALALAAANRREEAVDQLLDIARRDRKWNDDGARKQLVQFFEAWGPMDENTIYGRRRLSSILFS